MLGGAAVQDGPFRRKPDGAEVRNGTARRASDCAVVKNASTEPTGLASAIDKLGTRRWFGRNAEIYGAGEAADYFCKVIGGVVRSYKIVFDGRRLISAFYLPGDIFGLEPIERHLFSTEAVVDTEVLLVNRHAAISLAARDIGLARDLWGVTAAELRRTQSHMLLLNKSAPERVASFLLEMAERIDADHEIPIVMSRQDIADYLGVTSETVSRMLTRLETASAITLPNCRRIVLRDRPILRRMVD